MHPVHLIDDEARTVVDLWALHRPGLGGAGPLPFAGGTAEQPACLMAGFAIAGAAARALEKRPEGEG